MFPKVLLIAYMYSYIYYNNICVLSIGFISLFSFLFFFFLVKEYQCKLVVFGSIERRACKNIYKNIITQETYLHMIRQATSDCGIRH